MQCSNSSKLGSSEWLMNLISVYTIGKTQLTRAKAAFQISVVITRVATSK